MPDVRSATNNWGALRGKLQHTLLERIETGRLILPAMPSTAAKVIEHMESGGHQQRTAAFLEQDPPLALEVLRLANSASVGARFRVESIAQAVTALGAPRLRSLLLTASARQVFTSRNRSIRELTSALWKHSVGVAIVARQIAVRAAFQDKEASYMAGLMHDIGKPIVAIHLLDLERSISRSLQDQWIDPSIWLNIVEEAHRPIGMAVVKAWNLSPEICNAIRDCVEFDPVERKSAANAVRFANALAKREGLYVGPIDAAEVDTTLLIGRSMLGLDNEAVESLASSLRTAQPLLSLTP